MASHRDSRHAVQDAYCLRCAPQVHGAVRDVLGFARGILETELGSVVDNPVIADDGEVMISGNFHGEPLAFAADMLAMALAELASISERRVDRMLDPAFSRGPGRRSWRRTRAPTPATCWPSTPRPRWSARTRCSPTRPSVDTIPTSGKQEDHVSMGWTAVRKLREVAKNVRTCLAVEILCAAQGIDLRADIAPPSRASAAAHATVRASRRADGRRPGGSRADQRRRRAAAGHLRFGRRSLSRVAIAWSSVTVWINGNAGSRR